MKDIVNEIGRKLELCLDEIISSNLNHFKKESSFFVKTKYFNHEEFDLMQVDQSYDGSLELLVHYILYEENLYQKFLNERQLEKLEEVIKHAPSTIYGPDPYNVDEDDPLSDAIIRDEESAQDIQDQIDYNARFYVAKTLMTHGFEDEVKEAFDEEIYPNLYI